jgi:hypothetical protein
MAPFGLKLWENIFQMIPDISFSTRTNTDKSKLANILDENFRQENGHQKIDKLPVLEGLCFFGRNKQMRLEK